MGNSLFNLIQYGKENPAARGTPVAATKIWPGQFGNLGVDVKPEKVEEMLNVRMGSQRSVVYQRLYRNTIKVAQCSFQQLCFPFGGGLVGAVTPTEQTSNEGDYLWDFTPDLTAGNTNDPDSFTIELASMDEADLQYEVEYCLFDRLHLSGDIDQEGGSAAVAFEGGFFGRKMTETTATASLDLPAGEFMNAKLARLYVDTSWAGVGGTELTNLLRSFEIEILTGVHPDSTGGANNTFNAHKEGEIAVMGTFTIESGTKANDFLGYMQNATQLVARLAINGSQIGSGDTHNLTIDFSGSFESLDPIASNDRTDNLATFALTGQYNATGAKGLVVKVTTDSDAY